MQNDGAMYMGVRTRTWSRWRPTMDGKTTLGESSPANPARNIEEPLSMTTAADSCAALMVLVTQIESWLCSRGWL